MAFTSYATSSELATWLGTTAPTNADSLLRSATFVVAAAANRDPYLDTPDVAAAPVLRDATTAQVAAWVATGVTPAAGGLDQAPVKSRKIGSADVSYDTTGQDEARREAATMLTAEARQILYTGGLLALDLPVYTGVDHLDRYGLAGPTCGSLSLKAWRNL